MLTLKAALEEATAAIGRVDAQVLVAHHLGVNRAYLVANPMRILTESEDARIDLAVARRAMGHPVAYLTGKREFYSRDFAVGPGVLVPRPETEVLVEVALAKLRGTAGAPRVLDLGTGSGAIALSVLTEVPRAEVWATDISRDALDVASANLAGIGRRASRLTLCHGSWFDALPSALRGRVDVIVSNPPYIASDATLPEEVAGFEPHQALFSGALGFDDLEHLIAGAPGWLRPGGTLVLELSPEQADAACAAARDAGLRAPTVHPDLTGRLRALVAHAAVAHAA